MVNTNSLVDFYWLFCMPVCSPDTFDHQELCCPDLWIFLGVTWLQYQFGSWKLEFSMLLKLKMAKHDWSLSSYISLEIHESHEISWTISWISRNCRNNFMKFTKFHEQFHEIHEISWKQIVKFMNWSNNFMKFMKFQENHKEFQKRTTRGKREISWTYIYRSTIRETKREISWNSCFQNLGDLTLSNASCLKLFAFLEVSIWT